MSILLLLAVFVLVLLNGFFVAAEFALVRSRRGTLEAEAQEGKRGARRRRRGDRRPLALPVVLPARDHAHLAGHRLPRRARRGRPRRAAVRRPLARRHARDLAGHRLRAHHVAAHHDRRAGAEDLRDPALRADRAPRRAPAVSSSRASSARSSRCSTRPPTGSCGCSGSAPTTSTRGRRRRRSRC